MRCTPRCRATHHRSNCLHRHSALLRSHLMQPCPLLLSCCSPLVATLCLSLIN